MNRENPLTATGEELALVRQLVAGDRTAWHLFVQRYQALVRTAVTLDALLDAEDGIAQEPS